MSHEIETPRGGDRRGFGNDWGWETYQFQYSPLPEKPLANSLYREHPHVGVIVLASLQQCRGAS